MSPSKSSRNIDFTNFSTFAKWVFFNHTMNVFFPNFNIFLGVIENSACLLNKRFFAITTQIALVVAFRTIFNKMRRLAMWAIRNFSWLNYFFNLFFLANRSQKSLFIRVELFCYARHDKIPFSSITYKKFYQKIAQRSTHH